MSENEKDPLRVVKSDPPEEAQAAPTPPAPKSTAPAPPGVGDISDPASLRARIVEILKTVYDPEIPVNIFELGLIYDIKIADEKNIEVQMTLTAPGCPVAPQIVADVKSKVESVDGVETVNVDLTWDPPWRPEMMSEAARLTLNL